MGAQSTNVYVLEKPGTLKKMMKGNEKLTSLTINGIFNEKDLKYISTLHNLKVLDLSNATLSPNADLRELSGVGVNRGGGLNILMRGFFGVGADRKRKSNDRIMLLLDTLKCPKGHIESEALKFPDWKICFYSYYHIFYPRYVVTGDDICINYFKESPNNDYSGINVFPSIPYSSIKDELKITGTLYLKDAISVGDYFSNTMITRVVFSNKIQKIEPFAFRSCYKLEDVIFEDNTNIDIRVDDFPKDRPIRIRVPYGQIQKFVYLGFPESILIDKTPDIKLEVDVKTPGTLAKELDLVDIRLIQALTIKGILNTEDFKIINEMISLERLDLKDAIVFVSVAEKKADAADVAFLLGMANEAQYQKDGNYQNYKLRNEVNKRVEQGYDNTFSCELPRNAFLGNPLIESIKLPATLININRAGIGGSEGFSLSRKDHLKEIWISKASAETVPINRIVDETKVQIRFY